MIAAAENGEGRTLAEIHQILGKLERAGEKGAYQTYGPTICPHATCVSRGLDFESTQVSDCVVVSAEVSPAGVVNLVSHCWTIAMSLLPLGVMVRGYVTRGKIFHENSKFMGSGYQEAYGKESQVSAFRRDAGDTGTPFIEIDPKVGSYVDACGDACVKEMFSRCIKRDGAVAVIFPFQRLSHDFMIGGVGGHRLDIECERVSNNNVRTWIHNMKAQLLKYVPAGKERALRKAEHYIAALDVQLEICDRTDDFLDSVKQPFPVQQMRDIRS